MFNIIIVVVSWIAFRVAIKICLGTFSFPSFLSKSDSFKLSHKFYSKSEPDNSDNSSSSLAQIGTILAFSSFANFDSF